LVHERRHDKSASCNVVSHHIIALRKTGMEHTFGEFFRISGTSSNIMGQYTTNIVHILCNFTQSK
jgi:hypothetical protein